MEHGGQNLWSSWAVKMEDEPKSEELTDIGCLSPSAATCLPMTMLQSSKQRFTADINHLVQEVNFPLRQDSDWSGSSHSSSSQTSLASDSSSASVEILEDPHLLSSPRAVHRQRERDRHRSTVVALQEMARVLPVSEDGQKQTKCRVLQQAIQYIDWLHTELKVAYTDLGIEPSATRISLKDVCRELGVSPAILTMSPAVLSYDLHLLAKHIESRCLDKYCSPKLEYEPDERTYTSVDQMEGIMAVQGLQHAAQQMSTTADISTANQAGEESKCGGVSFSNKTVPCGNVTTPKQSKKRWMTSREARPRRKTKPKKCCTECQEDPSPSRELGRMPQMGRRLDTSMSFPRAKRALFKEVQPGALGEDDRSMEATVPNDDGSTDSFSAFFQPEKKCGKPRSPSPLQVVPMDQADSLNKPGHLMTPAVAFSDIPLPDKDFAVPEVERMGFSKPSVDDYFNTSSFGRPSSCPPCYSAAMAAPPNTFSPPIWMSLNEQSIFDNSNSSVDSMQDGSFAGQFLTSGDEGEKDMNQEVPSQDRDEDSRGSGMRRRRFSYGRAKNKKKCVNGFIMFCKIVREEQKQRYSGYASTQISTMMGRKWATMSPAERKPYKDAAYEFSLRNNRNVIVQKPLPHDAFGMVGSHRSTSAMANTGSLYTSGPGAPVSSAVSGACVPVGSSSAASDDFVAACCILSDASGDDAAAVEELQVT